MQPYYESFRSKYACRIEHTVQGSVLICQQIRLYYLPFACLFSSILYCLSEIKYPVVIFCFSSIQLFRKDLISAMKLPDTEQLQPEEYFLITDPWRQDWESGVQVPVNPEETLNKQINLWSVFS